MMSRSLAALTACPLLLVALGCGDDGATTSESSSAGPGSGGGAVTAGSSAVTTTGGPVGTTAPATGVGGGSGVGGGAGTGGSGGEDLPGPAAVATACAEPVVTVGARWSAPADGRLIVGSMAWTGTVGAVAYAASVNDYAWDVFVQLVDGAGDAIGDPIVLGREEFEEPGGAEPLPVPSVSMTAAGKRFVACWTGADGGGSFGCASIDEEGVASPGLLEPGGRPAVALGPAGVGLVYLAGDELLGLRLGADALPIGEPQVVLTSSDAFEGVILGLAASSVGYVGYADAVLPRFDASFDDLDAAALGWTTLPIALAGSDDVFGAVWGSLDGVKARVMGPGEDEFGEDVRIDGAEGSTSAFTATITRGDASFATAWAAPPGVLYAGVDLDGQPRGEPIVVLESIPTISAVAATGVTDGFLVGASIVDDPEEIVVVHLACLR